MEAGTKENSPVIDRMGLEYCFRPREGFLKGAGTMESLWRLFIYNIVIDKLIDGITIQERIFMELRYVEVSRNCCGSGNIIKVIIIDK